MARTIDRSEIRPPPALLTMAEGWRALVEASTLLPSIPWLNCLPRGDGHPVYVLPGFMADSASTAMLCRWLDRLGYAAIPWGFGRNLGPRGNLQERLVDAVSSLAAEHGERVTLVGQSLGGIFAREIAKVVPQHVRQVVTLGAPFGQMKANGTTPAVLRLFELAVGERIEELREREDRLTDLSAPPPVPCTAIFSRSDGVADWRSCIEIETPLTDNVEVVASHCGMGFNPVIYYVIADRLSQPPAEWRKFDRRGLRMWLYPDAIYARDTAADPLVSDESDAAGGGVTARSG